jgi:hypothetical protein
MSVKKRLGVCESVMTGALTIQEARRRRAEILQRSRRGRLLLRIERAERIGLPRSRNSRPTTKYESGVAVLGSSSAASVEEKGHTA